MKKFRTFSLAVVFYRQTRCLKVRGSLREQLNRASASIALNLAEGRGKRSVKDQKKFFQLAFGSVRECQAILILEKLKESESWETLDSLAAHLYRLIENA